MRFMACVIELTWAMSGCSQPVGLPAPPPTVPTPSPSSDAAPDVTDVLPSGRLSSGPVTAFTLFPQFPAIQAERNFVP